MSIVLVVNDSPHPVKVFIYLTKDRLKWLPESSRAVLAGRSDIFQCPEQGRTVVLYEFEAERCGERLGSVKTDRHIMIRLSEGGCLERKPLAENDPYLLQVQKLKTVETFASSEDLYGLLELNRTDMWKMSDQEQATHIRRSFHRLIRQRHPDKAPNDLAHATLAAKTIEAHLVLSCPKSKRAYDRHVRSGSMMSRDFWQQLWADACASDRCWKVQFGFSLVCLVGGIVAIALTAGAATPGVILLYAAGSAALVGGGYLTARELLKLENRERGMNALHYCKFFLGGALAGAAAGVSAGGGMCIGLTGAAGLAAAGAIAGGGGGAALGLAEQMADEEWTPNKLLRAAVVGGVGGAAAGAVAGSIGGHFAANLADEAGGLAGIALKKAGFKAVQGAAGEASKALVTGFVEVAGLDQSNGLAPIGDRAAEAAASVAQASLSGAGTGALESTGEDGTIWIGLQSEASTAVEVCMVVEYVLSGEMTTRIARGHGHGVSVPIQAQCVTVKFNTWLTGVSRPVGMWNRMTKEWCEGEHVFRYPSPEARIFVLAGNVWSFWYIYVKEVLDGTYAAVDDEGVAQINVANL